MKAKSKNKSKAVNVMANEKQSKGVSIFKKLADESRKQDANAVIKHLVSLK